MTWKDWPEETAQWVDFDQIDNEALYLFWTKGSLKATFETRKLGKSPQTRRTRKETTNIINSERKRVIEIMEQSDPIRSLIVKINGNPSLTLLDRKFWQPGKTYQEKEVAIDSREWRKEKNPVTIKNRQKRKVW